MRAMFSCLLQVRRCQNETLCYDVYLLLSVFHSGLCNVCESVSFYWIRVCISRFKDCPLCGADIERIEADTDLQSVVDRFVDGHARIKRSHVDMDKEGKVGENKKVIYEDVSLERGAFLVQQAMRVS